MDTVEYASILEGTAISDARVVVDDGSVDARNVAPGNTQTNVNVEPER